MDGTRFDHLAKSVGNSSSRRRVLKALGGGAAGGLGALFGIGLRRADAMPIQNAFVNECRQTLGEPRSVGTRQVRCTYPCAFYTQCNFFYEPPLCFDVLLTC
ncbi:MAG TPA: hypothetical protein VFQ80_18475 [Thermomicrobiales bacterium]|jgi:hypothetical protein|nr:hypothetical protein [Thermomicrobiales bacterium]